jgi:hypothetical protein
MEEKKPAFPFNLKAEVCSVIQDTGYVGSAEDYIRQFYGKGFDELTVNEAEMIIANLQDKKGCLYETKEGGYSKPFNPKEA